jgi:dTDP-glucose pyrophosphorylase
MIDQKFAELEKAAQEFKAALIKFQSVYDPETVGIVEFCEQIDEVLFDIDQELQEQE